MMFAAALVWQIGSACGSVAWICRNLTVDDTYLALQVARGWAEHGVPTFDGLHRTNGFQALWGIALWPIARIISEPVALLRACLILVAVLNTATGLILWRFMRRVAGVSAGVWAAALWTMYCLAGRPAMIGLENALAAMIAAVVITRLWRLRERPRSIGSWGWAAFSLGLLCWTRLDCAVIVGVVMLGLLGVAWRRRCWGGYLLAGATLLVLAGGLVAFNMWAAETPTPISGLVKRHIAVQRQPTLTTAVIAESVAATAMTLLKCTSAATGTLSPPVCSSVVRGGVVIMLVVVLINRRFQPDRWIGWWWGVLIAHVLVIRLWLSDYYSDTLWYYSPEYVSAVLLLALVCDTFGRQVFTRRDRWKLPAALVAIRLVFAAAALILPDSHGDGLSDNRLAAAKWLREHVADGERVAAWNAGELAYFSGAALISLDGLVNDREYLALILSGRTGQAYWNEQQVEWLVDYRKNMDWIPHDRWREVAVFGDDERTAQLVLQRRHVRR